MVLHAVISSYSLAQFKMLINSTILRGGVRDVFLTAWFATSGESNNADEKFCRGA